MDTDETKSPLHTLGQHILSRQGLICCARTPQRGGLSVGPAQVSDTVNINSNKDSNNIWNLRGYSGVYYTLAVNPRLAWSRRARPWSPALSAISSSAARPVRPRPAVGGNTQDALLRGIDALLRGITRYYAIRSCLKRGCTGRSVPENGPRQKMLRDTRYASRS